MRNRCSSMPVKRESLPGGESIATDPNKDAPVISRHEITITAPIQTIWDIQTDVNGWPSWQPDATAPRMRAHSRPARCSGGRRPGSTSPLPSRKSTRRIGSCGAALRRASSPFTSGPSRNETPCPRPDRRILGRRTDCRPTRRHASRSRRIVARLAGEPQAHGRGQSSLRGHAVSELISDR
jgi:hypothetical protein